MGRKLTRPEGEGDGEEVPRGGAASPRCDV